MAGHWECMGTSTQHEPMNLAVPRRFQLVKLTGLRLKRGRQPQYTLIISRVLLKALQNIAQVPA